MTVKEMHYAFKQRLNKIDSQQYPNILIPEIDIYLNQAQSKFIQRYVEPRSLNTSGSAFEVNQRVIDEVSNIVVERQCLTASQFSTTSSFTVTLPQDYMYYVQGQVIMTKEQCADIEGKLLIKQHDDMHEESPFDNSSFEWRTVNGRFYEDKIRVFTDGTFTINEVCISYLRRPAYIHNAEDFDTGSYTDLNGNVLVGSQDCELNENAHDTIVDIAVLIATNDLETNFALKAEKLKINN